MHLVETGKRCLITRVLKNLTMGCGSADDCFFAGVLLR